MAVTFDANATSNTFGNAVSTLDNGNLTVGAGSNRCLVVQIALRILNPGDLAIVWDPAGANQSLSQLVFQNSGSGGNSKSAHLFGLVNPVSGNKIIRATWTGSTKVLLNGVSWTGVNQTGGATTFPNTTQANGNSVSPEKILTSSVGNAAMDSIASQFQTLSAPTQTQTYLDGTNAYELLGGGSRADGAATVDFGWAITPGDEWALVAVDIQSAAGATPSGLMWLK